MRITLLLTLALTACFDPSEGRDRDGDGFQTAELGGDDCDDDNININPDATEVCGNGIDDNCDGMVDDAGAGSVQWYVDLDQDGFPAPEVQEGCARPAGVFADLSNGVDCDDTEAAVNPNATEVWYDGVDQDCSGGSDDDADGDGYIARIRGGDDCHDGLAEVNPGMPEVCNNGLDDDCDGGPGDCEYSGEVDELAVAALTIALSNVTYAAFGDVTADGVEDVLLDRINQNDELFVYPGPLNAVPSDPIVNDRLTCVPDERRRGRMSTRADFNGDGANDLVVMCREEGALLLFMAPVGPFDDPGRAPVDTADAGLGQNSGNGSFYAYGLYPQFMTVGDWNSDGADDLLLTAPDALYLEASPFTGLRFVEQTEDELPPYTFLPEFIAFGERFPAITGDGNLVVRQVRRTNGNLYLSSVSSSTPSLAAYDRSPTQVEIGEDLTADDNLDWFVTYPAGDLTTAPVGVVVQPDSEDAPNVVLDSLGQHPFLEVGETMGNAIACDINLDGASDLVVPTRRRTGVNGFSFYGVEIYFGPEAFTASLGQMDAWFEFDAPAYWASCGDSYFAIGTGSDVYVLPKLGQ